MQRRHAELHLSHLILTDDAIEEENIQFGY